MRCLTSEECADWVAEHGFVAFPYGVWDGYPALTAGHYCQFPIRDKGYYVARCLVELVDPATDALLWVLDGGWDDPPVDALISAVRRSHGETRPLGVTPGHLYGPSEWDEMAGLFLLTMEIGGCAYLYTAGSGTTFYNWEGTLIDTWAKDPGHADAIRLFAAEMSKGGVAQDLE